MEFISNNITHDGGEYPGHPDDEVFYWAGNLPPCAAIANKINWEYVDKYIVLEKAEDDEV